ncbi:glutathione-disulfide reductase [Xanthomonas sp. XNM01]|uniref:glutathione-disulfide reductase n=1 Tax=Xanthomonas sp. XNM01 TaxID=2769289 RepID=UPI001785DCC1|nr:glutathione-disulfide reductase [Xanthomonas sp. XNM01]MBD9368595.1 glutathione-disulfide reductase [Xanthomonas sp. XNM01]
MNDSQSLPRVDYDLVVLGGGSAGMAGAFRAAAHGARVALLEPHALGGTCVNLGCVPKKAMWLAADLATKMTMAADLGFDVERPQLDWPTFITHRERYIANVHVSYRKRMDEAGIALMPCRGHLEDAHTVHTSTGVRLRAGRVLIATGARAQRPALPGAELGLVSDDFFDLRRAPQRVALVGGGYIGVELAGVLQALGSHVSMFVRGPRLLQAFDAELAIQLGEDMRQHGVRLHFDHQLQALEQAGAGRVRLRHKTPSPDAAGEGDVFDAVLFATGRRPNSDGLGLEEAGVALGEHGEVVVDAYENTSVEGVHAVGDVNGKLALTPVAIAAARQLMDRLFGGKPDARLDYADVPTVVFSHPPVGTVGLCEAKARELHGDSVRVYESNFRPMLHVLADSPQRSVFRMICAGEDERVVGLHLLGEGADEILQGFAVALKMGATKRDFDRTVAIHPTSAEEVVLMR